MSLKDYRKYGDKYSDLCFAIDGSFSLTSDERYVDFSQLSETRTEQTFENVMLLVMYAAELAMISGETISVPLTAREREGGKFDLEEMKRNIIGAYDVLDISHDDRVKTKPAHELIGEFKTSRFNVSIGTNHNQDPVFSEDSQSIPYVEITITKPKPLPPPGRGYMVEFKEGWF